MSYLSRVIPLARARSSSPIVINPKFIGSSGITAAARSRTPPLRSLSASFGSDIPNGSDHSRGYATAFAGFGATTAGADVNGLVHKRTLARLMSDVAVPEPPTSNHPHKAIPGAGGQLIYTET